MEIPLDIDTEEALARIILHSYHYSESKNKIRPEAFTPSPDEVDEISVLRYRYTNSDFCKVRGLTIASRRNTLEHPCKFIGLAFLFNKEVNEISSTLDEISCKAIASPYDENDNLRTDSPIMSTDSGIPMHADIKYSITVEQDKPINQLVKQHIAKNFCKLAQPRFFKDTDKETQTWVGDAITI